MTDFDKIVDNLCKYMKNTDGEKQIENHLLPLIKEGNMSKDELVDQMLMLFDKYAPPDVKTQIYREIENSF